MARRTSLPKRRKNPRTKNEPRLLDAGSRPRLKGEPSSAYAGYARRTQAMKALMDSEIVKVAIYLVLLVVIIRWGRRFCVSITPLAFRARLITQQTSTGPRS